jgi:hypothetical protein
MDKDFLTAAVAWATIGQLVIGVIDFVWQNRDDLSKQKITIRHIARWLTLPVLGFLTYWLSIVVATLSPGTAPIVVARATAWATSLGIALGIIWTRILFPTLAQRSKIREKNKDSDNESK